MPQADEKDIFLVLFSLWVKDIVLKIKLFFYQFFKSYLLFPFCLHSYLYPLHHALKYLIILVLIPSLSFIQIKIYLILFRIFKLNLENCVFQAYLNKFVFSLLNEQPFQEKIYLFIKINTTNWFTRHFSLSNANIFVIY